MKTVADWKFYCTNARFCQVVLFDNDKGMGVYDGVLSDVPNEYLDYNVCSFDPVFFEYPCICLNIAQSY